MLADLQQLTRSARERVASAVNAELTMLYWRIGVRLRKEVLSEQRAEYGRQIVDAVATDLVTQFGKGIEWTNLFRMIRFAELFPDEPIVATVSPQLSWLHILDQQQLKNKERLYLC